jgi:hypothetical protein
MRLTNVLPVVAALVGASSPAFAGCSSLSSGAMQPIVENFVFGPKYLLEQTENADRLSFAISDLLIANGRLTLPKIIELVRIASTEQKLAIGTGMASAAKACITPEPQTSAAIRDAVRDLRDGNLSRAFNNAIAATELDPAAFNVGPDGAIGGSTLGGAVTSNAPSVGRGTLGINPAVINKEQATKTDGRLGFGSNRLWDPFAAPAINNPKDRFNTR